MKNYLIILSFALMISIAGILSGCSEKEVINVNAENITDNTVLGRDALIEIGNLLYYDSSTGIVYWWNGYLSKTRYDSTTPTPYYSPNGYLYRFNPQTNTFEEIIPNE